MMDNRFNYSSETELISHSQEMGFDLPWNNDYSSLFQPFDFGRMSIGNRFVVHPMEGFDSKPNGAPGELTTRRYKRFAQGGSGLIWMEAISVSDDGRSNPHQLYMNKANRFEFSRINEIIKSTGFAAGKSQDEIKSIVQLTHSGQFSKPSRAIEMLSDDDLKRIRDAHVQAAIWSDQLGFDAVDIKICHGYLTHELQSSFKREDSIYGGPLLENRIRMVAEIIEGIEESCNISIAVRLNVYDGLEGGFGCNSDDYSKINLDEAKEIVQSPQFKGVELWSITAGIPHKNPWVTRPFDKPVKNSIPSPEHPLVGAMRMINLVTELKKMTSKPVLGAGLSWFRQYFPQVSSGIITKGAADAVGIGRLAFAYPNIPNDIYSGTVIDKKKVCVTCSGCTSRMREGLHTGCIIRDREVYA